MWEKIKKVLNYIALPFVILVSFIIGHITYNNNIEDDKEIKDKIKDASKEVKDLEKETTKVSKELQEKEKALNDSISKSENVLDEVKASKEQRDKEAEKFFKK